MRLKVIILFCLFTLAGMSAWAIDLTGTWEGKQVCQYFDGRKTEEVALAFTSEIDFSVRKCVPELCRSNLR